MSLSASPTLNEIAELLRNEARKTRDAAAREAMLNAADNCIACRKFHNDRECRIVDVYSRYLTDAQQEAATEQMEAIDERFPWDWSEEGGGA